MNNKEISFYCPCGAYHRYQKGSLISLDRSSFPCVSLCECACFNDGPTASFFTVRIHLVLESMSRDALRPRCFPPVRRQTVIDDGADGIAAGLQRPLGPLVSGGPAEIQYSLHL